MKSWFYTNGKRIGAFTLVFALVLTLCFSEGIGSLVTVLAGESAVWDGSTAKSYAGGRGTKDDPFQIATGEQLAKLVKDTSTTGNYYKLTADIRLNDTTDADWMTKSPKQWVGGGNAQIYFKGTLEGNGHTVSGMYYKDENADEGDGAGLFIGVIGATIRNLGITDASLTVRNADGRYTVVGSLAGRAKDNQATTTITGCWADETVTICSTKGAGGFLGGGMGGRAAFTNCYFTGKLESDDASSANAFYGNEWGDYFSIQDCYTVGSKVSNSTPSPFENVYGTEAQNGVTVLTKEQMTGDAAKANMPKLDWKTPVWKTADGKTPQLNVISTDYVKPEEGDDMGVPGEVWTGATAPRYAGGRGTKDDPYQIATGEQLAKLVKDTSTTGNYYKLTYDIRLNDTEGENWTSDSPKSWFDNSTAGYFQGTLEGDGHTISGLYYRNETAGDGGAVGLFVGVMNAAIRNLGVTDTAITIRTAESYTVAGSLAGYVKGNNTITGCFADDTVTICSTKGAGGFVGGGTGGTVTFTNCYFTGKVESDQGKNYAFYGDEWDGKFIKLQDCYTVGSRVSMSDPSILKNVYSTEAQSGVTVLTKEQMTGDAAKTNMPALDWDTVWTAMEGKTPRLRAFVSGDVSEGIWDGSTAKSYAGGRGTKDDPFQIATGEQLAKLATDGDSTAGNYYVLTNDIRLNDTTDADWTTNSPKQWVGGGNNETYFQGTLEGGGHTVSGMYINVSGAYCYGGLFERVRGNVTIRNLGITNASLTVNGTDDGPAGALAGTTLRDSKVTVVGCWADDSVTVKGKIAGGFIGCGGANMDMTFSNCYFTGKTIADGDNANAFCGSTWTGANVTIKNCYTVGNKVCRDSGDTTEKVYATEPATAKSGVTILTEAQMTGDAAKANMPKLDWKTPIWKTVADGTPKLNVISTDYVEPVEGDDMGVPGEVWTGDTASGYAGGRGTKDDPYQIATGEQLARLVMDTNTTGKYYKLTYDIRLNDTSVENWTSNSPKAWVGGSDAEIYFKGTLEGDGHTVSGIYINGTKQYFYCGLFSRVGNGATIRNLGITASSITSAGTGGEAYAGALAGATAKDSKVTIIGCWADDSVKLKATNATGGFIGCGAGGMNMTFSNCYFIGSTECSDESAANAFCGSTWTGANVTIENCYTVGNRVCRDSGGDTTKNVYATEPAERKSGVTILTKEQMTGDAAKANMPKLDWKTPAWKTANGKTPQLLGIPDDYRDPSIGDGETGKVWTGKTSSDYAGGDGSEGTPYLISTAEQLAKLLNTVVTTPSETAGKYYKLTADILLNDTSASDWEKSANQWYTAGSSASCFQGHFDGDGHVVKGLFIDQSGGSSPIYAGLFPAVKYGSSIKNVGLSQSHISISSDESEAYAGGITGYVHFWQDADNVPASDYPVIEGCFGDTTVTIEAQFCGGILCGAPRQFTIRNCYFVGTLDAYGDRAGGIVGNAWVTQSGATVTNCYAATTDEDSASGWANPAISYSNTYSTADSINGIFAVSLNGMQGDIALERMNGLDYKRVWKTVENGTPVLRKFNSDEYSNMKSGRKVKISFVSNGGTELEPIYGDEGEKIVWPEISRYGYEFEGWYVYQELDARFESDVFPMYDMTLYANWTKTGIEQGFESYSHNDEDGMGSDYQYFRPGVLNYSADMVHGGSKAIVRLGEVNEEQDLLLFGDELGTLTVGKEYDLTFWIYTDETNAKPTLKLGYTNYPDVIEPAFAYVEIPLAEALPSGEWHQVHYTFIASSPYLVFRTPGVKMVLDDFHIVPTGQSGEPDVSNPSSPGGNVSPSTGEVAVTGIIAMAAVLSVYLMVAFRSRKRRCVK